MRENMWSIDTSLRRAGGDEDDEHTTGFDAPDWVVWLVRRQHGGSHHMVIQFPRPGIDRAAAELLVAKIIAGLNSTSNDGASS